MVTIYVNIWENNFTIFHPYRAMEFIWLALICSFPDYDQNVYDIKYTSKKINLKTVFKLPLF